MNEDTAFSPEFQRYTHHMSLFPKGEEDQKRIKESAVLIVGVGGLGSVSSTLLARAGVGRIGIIDRDVVSRSNLQRQILYSDEDVGVNKVAVAKKRLIEINPEVSIDAYNGVFEEMIADEIIRQYSLVVDGSDNMATRYLINRKCLAYGIPYVYGAVDRFDGQVSVFWKDHGPCLACLFPQSPPAQKPAIHVFSPLVLMVGALQANEALKIITGIPEPLIGQLLLFNTLEMRFNKVRIPINEGCPVCGK